MERIELKYDLACRAVSTLKEALDEYAYAVKSESEKKQKIFRDSVIQRFEYSIDILWKYLKEYLNQEYGVEAKSPKTVFKEFGRIELISEDEVVKALSMVDNRNSSSHMYHEERIEEIAKEIPGHYKLMKTFLDRLKPVKNIFAKGKK